MGAVIVDEMVELALWDLMEHFLMQEVPLPERHPESGLLKENEVTRKLAARLSEVAGRPEPWSGLYIVNVLKRKIGASKAMRDAALHLVQTVESNMPNAYAGTTMVQAFALPGRVAPGTLILGRSRDCKRPACPVKFLPTSHNQAYHSPECKRLDRIERKLWKRRDKPTT